MKQHTKPAGRARALGFRRAGVGKSSAARRPSCLCCCRSVAVLHGTLPRLRAWTCHGSALRELRARPSRFGRLGRRRARRLGGAVVLLDGSRWLRPSGSALARSHSRKSRRGGRTHWVAVALERGVARRAADPFGSAAAARRRNRASRARGIALGRAIQAHPAGCERGRCDSAGCEGAERGGWAGLHFL